MSTTIMPDRPALALDSVRFTSNQTAILDDAAACAVLDLPEAQLDRYRDGDELYVRSTGAKMYYQPDDTWLIVGYQSSGADVLKALPEIVNGRRPRWGRYLPVGTKVTVDTGATSIHDAFRPGVVADDGVFTSRGDVWACDPDGHSWTCNRFRIVGFRGQVIA